jgi:hypothetical protein
MISRQRRTMSMLLAVKRLSQRGAIMKNSNTPGNPSDDLGKLVLRVLLAGLILFHGVSKLIGGVGFIAGMLAKAGLPAAFGYLVYIGEVVALLGSGRYSLGGAGGRFN